MDLEYVVTPTLTEKSDIYSYRVVLLDDVKGRTSKDRSRRCRWVPEVGVMVVGGLAAVAAGHFLERGT
ncbi:hypothetical protein HanRHA438_Chr06g0285221 [Helianthus annuus]|nr:hypothetical protein HanRHA438_Chr06g0285221 [Helianthus annuus]